VRDLAADDAEAKRYGIDKVPATIVLAERDPGIRFNGLTGGYEFTSLLEAILMGDCVENSTAGFEMK
jgi:predicted DsbA family dithiol-disulfide isomerase